MHCFKYRGASFAFEITKMENGRMRIYLLSPIPPCPDKNRPMDGGSISLLDDGVGAFIWIAESLAPRDVETARRLAETWTEQLMDYYDGGPKVVFPRDPDL
jgi:hypothetical protein